MPAVPGSEGEEVITDLLNNAAGLEVKQGAKYLIFVDERVADLSALIGAQITTDINATFVLMLPNQRVSDHISTVELTSDTVLFIDESCVDKEAMRFVDSARVIWVRPCNGKSVIASDEYLHHVLTKIWSIVKPDPEADYDTNNLYDLVREGAEARAREHAVGAGLEIPTRGEREAWKNGAEAERLRCARIADEGSDVCACACGGEIAAKIRSKE